jgi:hypothetical protein
MSKQLEFFEGYRPLITHNRKRNTIPEEIPKGEHCRTGREWNRPENPPVRHTPMRRPPLPIRGGLAGRNKEAIFKAKVEALIERFKPVEAGTKERIGKWKA